jgi:PilZ domain
MKRILSSRSTGVDLFSDSLALPSRIVVSDPPILKNRYHAWYTTGAVGSPRATPMIQESRCAEKYAFPAAAEVEHSAVVRKARVRDLRIHGCYLAMPDPFSESALVLVKIRTRTEFFQADATVAHSTFGAGMGVMFNEVSPPFLIVLQRWLSEATGIGTARRG